MRALVTRRMRALALVAFGAAIVVAERAWPLRKRTQVSRRRAKVNVAMAAATVATVGLAQHVAMNAAHAAGEKRGLGLLRVLGLPRWLARPIGFVLLDYTLWHWHRLLHHPILWRFHAVHHADLDLAASTALRFHPGEMLASIPMRVAQVVLLGADRATERAWNAAVLVSIMFHHSNLALPPKLDAALSRLIVTPRMHGVHHSARPYALDTSFGTIFAIWDDLHRTRGPALPQSDVHIGLVENLGGEEGTVRDALVRPFER
jgi:sterol desaturase/sphingolipid hydroxylase (fatty acid hydroxylase superfamily)